MVVLAAFPEGQEKYCVQNGQCFCLAPAASPFSVGPLMGSLREASEYTFDEIYPKVAFGDVLMWVFNGNLPGARHLFGSCFSSTFSRNSGQMANALCVLTGEEDCAVDLIDTEYGKIVDGVKYKYPCSHEFLIRITYSLEVAYDAKMKMPIFTNY